MAKEKNCGHVFALYVDGLSSNAVEGAQFVLKDRDAVRRMASVLRMLPGDSCVLFDRDSNATFSLDNLGRSKAVGHIGAVQKNVHFTPKINFLLPVLKRDALEQAVYALTETGINSITLVLCDGVRNKFGSATELDRLRRIVIAAAEQSKNFNFPKIVAPIKLSEAIETIGSEDTKICFEVFGSPACELAKDLCGDNGLGEAVMTVGPESGFSEVDLELLRGAGFNFYKLTPTVLRACQAAAVAGGFVRSLAK